MAPSPGGIRITKARIRDTAKAENDQSGPRHAFPFTSLFRFRGFSLSCFRDSYLFHALLSQPPYLLQVGLDHHADQMREADFRFPAELPVRLAGVADQQIDLGGANQRWILDHV